MKNWEAPLIVLTLGTIGSLIVGEYAAIILWTGIALLGYALNKSAN